MRPSTAARSAPTLQDGTTNQNFGVAADMVFARQWVRALGGDPERGQSAGVSTVRVQRAARESAGGAHENSSRGGTTRQSTYAKSRIKLLGKRQGGRKDILDIPSSSRVLREQSTDWIRSDCCVHVSRKIPRTFINNGSRMCSCLPNVPTSNPCPHL